MIYGHVGLIQIFVWRGDHHVLALLVDEYTASIHFSTEHEVVELTRRFWPSIPATGTGEADANAVTKSKIKWISSYPKHLYLQCLLQATITEARRVNCILVELVFEWSASKQRSSMSRCSRCSSAVVNAPSPSYLKLESFAKTCSLGQGEHPKSVSAK